MRRFRSFMLVTAVVAALAWPGIPSQAASSFGVDIKNTAYSPKTAKVTIGDTVVWTNQDEAEHTVTFDDGFDSNPSCPGLLGETPCMRKGESASRLFTTPGSYAYHCRRHASMTGSVVVESVTTSSSPISGTSTTSTTGGTSASSTTSTTFRVATTTTRSMETSSTVLRTTTTTMGVAYTPVPQGEAPAFDPDKGEDTSPVPDPDEAAEQVASGQGDESAAVDDQDGGGGGGGGAAVIIALLVVAAGGGGALVWKFRPKKA